MRNLTKNMLTLLSAYLSGYIYTYSLAPFSIWIIGILSPLMLLTIITKYRSHSLSIAYCYGAGYFAAGGWIWHSLMDHSLCGYFCSTLITLMFTLVLALSFLPLGFIQRNITKKHPALNCLSFPLAWVLCETIRTYSSFAYPWLMIAYSQTSSPLINILPYTGPYLFSFVVVSISSCLWGIYNIEKKPLKILLALFIIIISTIPIKDDHKPVGKNLNIAIVEGNIAPEDKLQINQVSSLIKMYKKIIAEYNKPDSLFLLPETAIPVVPKALQNSFAQIKEALTINGSAAIIGTFEANKEIYNAAITIGNATGKLYKNKLVAFGETTPEIPGLKFIIDKLSIPMSSLTPGADKQPLIQFKNHKIAVFICYEIAFPSEVIARSNGADFIVVLSDNAWFGNSSASYQHREIAQFYAHYLKKPVIYVNNSGLSSVINSNGEILQSLEMGINGVLTYQLNY